MSEWVAWHEGYAPGQQLSKRLEVVQRFIARALDAQPPGRIDVISMCAGDGRDLLGVLPRHGRGGDVHARLVEMDRELVGRGSVRASEARLSEHIDFVHGDASTTDAYAGAVPANLVLVCGVFGNISDEDVRNTVEHLPQLCAPAATVVWTRGTFEPDLTPAIREWFGAAGFAELDHVAIAGTTAGVGMHRLEAAPRPFQRGKRLFTFLEREKRPAQIARERSE